MLTGCVLITGTSRGIGLEFVRQLVKRSSITPKHIIATCRKVGIDHDLTPLICTSLVLLRSHLKRSSPTLQTGNRTRPRSCCSSGTSIRRWWSSSNSTSRSTTRGSRNSSRTSRLYHYQGHKNLLFVVIRKILCREIKIQKMSNVGELNSLDQYLQ